MLLPSSRGAGLEFDEQIYVPNPVPQCVQGQQKVGVFRTAQRGIASPEVLLPGGCICVGEHRLTDKVASVVVSDLKGQLELLARDDTDHVLFPCEHYVASFGTYLLRTQGVASIESLYD